jgi:hypothetical protein
VLSWLVKRIKRSGALRPFPSSPVRVVEPVFREHLGLPPERFRYFTPLLAPLATLHSVELSAVFAFRDDVAAASAGEVVRQPLLVPALAGIGLRRTSSPRSTSHRRADATRSSLRSCALVERDVLSSTSDAVRQTGHAKMRLHCRPLLH